jgi:uncharacterized SAM-binding protein YcdF (DUF218 family)
LVWLAVFTGATARLLLWPPRSKVEPCDAVLVLGPSAQRLPEALRLVEEGLAPALVVAVDDERDNDIKVPEGVEVVCFRPAPFTTRGEARYIGQLARTRGWTSLIVVSSVPQTTRARLRVQRCFPGRVAVVGVGPHRLGYWAYAVVYEWGALAKAVIWQRGC